MADLPSLIVDWLPALVGIVLLLFLVDYLDTAISPRAKKAVIGAALLAALAGLVYWVLPTD